MIANNVREFWACAQDFPPNKEAVYPAHAEAQEFAQNCGKSVLEYGCGGGSDTESYLSRGCRVMFADVVPGNVQVTLKRAQSFVATQRATVSYKPLILRDSDALGDVPDGIMDVVSAHGVLHHIEDVSMVDRVLRQFHRVLRPDGKLYVMLYTRDLYERYAEKIQMLRGSDPTISSWQAAFGYFTDGPGCPWATYYDVEQAYELFRANGFEVASTFSYNDSDFMTYRCKRA